MPGISASEKYAELEARGEERPKCKCHGEPQYWMKRSRALGGSWHCSIKSKEKSKSIRAQHHDAYLEYIRAYRRENSEVLKRYFRKVYLARKEAGLCVHCGKDVLITETRCFTCAGKQDEYNMLRSY